MMDETDQLLLNALAENARAPVTTLAAKLGIARTTVQARLERLERTGVIAGYTVRIGAAEQEQRITATVLVQLDPRTGPDVVQRLKSIPQVERYGIHTSFFGWQFQAYLIQCIELAFKDWTYELQFWRFWRPAS